MGIHHFYSSGQMGNRLISTAQLLAYALNQDQSFKSSVLGEAKEWFRPGTPNITLANRSEIKKKGIAVLARKIAGASFAMRRSSGCYILPDLQRESLETPSDRLRRVLECRHSVLLGYRFQGPRLLIDHAPQIRRAFALEPKLSGDLDSYWSHLGVDQTTLGIHIRRGDYKQWRGGQFYREWDWYREFAEKALQSSQTERVMFVSNEPIPAELLAGLPAVVGPGSAILDLYALSRCGYLAGPPSTFSLWAAYIGGSQIHHFDEDEEFVRFSAVDVEFLTRSIVI